ncbi:MAG: chromosome segregation protein SMC, partial [Gammaproteobacteria bacterium]
MRLKAIKLAGFKSFVDPTTVSFPSNMSAIVGPNGCGKSNIIDAVRWVMGESSAKHLRGESMTDVIFNGSTARKPVGQASIELIFDNTQGKLVGEYAAFSEISVKRRVTREGQSQYFLNGSKCRRKDVTDLFLGTGLGPRSYAIIEQGMISRLIESKPEELRVFIEEAAGISRYKERRKETESRIRRTQENLERLRDVREELDRQLEKLRRQARDAERYKALKGDERALTARLTALRWTALDEQVATAEAATQEVEARLEDELNARLTLDGQREARLQEQDDQSRALDEAQQRYFDTQSRMARLEQRIQHAAERRQQLEADKEALARQLDELVAEQVRERETLSQLQEELAELEPELEERRFVEEEKALALEDAEAAMQAWQERWDTFNAETSELKHAAERAQADVRQQEQRLDDLRRRCQRMDETLTGLALDETEAALAEAQLEAEACQQRLQTSRQLQQDAREALLANEQALESVTDQLTDLNQQLSALEGERASLETLLSESKNEDGLSRWAEAAGIQLLRLLDEVEVSEGWDAAVEAVLGQRLSESRVMQGDWPTVWPEVGARLVSRVQGVACTSWPDDALARAVKAPAAVLDWLQGARKAADFDAALGARDALGPGEFWVTPEGHQVGREWVIRSGQAQDDSLLVRKRRLDAVCLQISQLEHDREACQVERDALVQARAELRERLQSSEQALQRAQRDEASQMAQMEALRAKCDQMRERRSQIIEEREELAGQAEDLAVALEVARNAWDEAVARLEAVGERREQLLDERDQTRSRMDECKS